MELRGSAREGAREGVWVTAMNWKESMQADVHI